MRLFSTGAASVLAGLLTAWSVAVSPVAAAAEPDAACPASSPVPGFDDVDATATHGPAIACVAAYGITQGVTSASYRPGGSVDRAQLATFVVRLLRAAGEPVPVPGPGRFDDLGDSPHAGNVEALAELGIIRGTSSTTFTPGAPVRRDQMASFLVGVVDHLGLALDPGTSRFADVPDSNLHRPAIERLAGAGLVHGRAAGVYDPQGLVSRGQMASFLARVTELLAAAELVHTPDVGREVVVPASTVVLDPPERATITAVVDDAVEFSVVPERLAVGDVLVSAPSGNAPAGLLRRVRSIDGTRVRTGAAALADTVHAGAGRASAPLRADRVRERHVAPGVEVSAPDEDTVHLDLGDGIPLAEGVTASGSVTFTATTEAVIDVARRRSVEPYVARVEIVTHTDLRTRLELQATTDAELGMEVVLYRVSLAPLVVTLGPVPVVLLPEVEVVLDAAGEVSTSTSIAADHDGAGTVGVRYTPAGGWTASTGWSATVGDPDVDLDAPFAARLGAGVTSGVALEGGPRIASGVTTHLRGSALPDRDPAWQVHAGTTIDARAEENAGVLPGVTGFDRTVLAREELLTEAPPPIPDPVRLGDGWYAAPGTGPVHGTGGGTVRYTVEIADGLASRQDLTAFARFVEARLGEPRKGWTSRGTVRMQRVDDPSRATIRVLLAAPTTVDRLCAQAGLDTGGIYSCWNGRFAVLNSARWFNGVSHVGDLELYRGYLVNHEVGHGLGHGHRGCPGTGRTAPVMMQLTKSTYGCVPNPHPYP